MCTVSCITFAVQCVAKQAHRVHEVPEVGVLREELHEALIGNRTKWGGNGRASRRDTGAADKKGPTVRPRRPKTPKLARLRPHRRRGWRPAAPAESRGPAP